MCACAAPSSGHDHSMQSTTRTFFSRFVLGISATAILAAGACTATPPRRHRLTIRPATSTRCPTRSIAADVPTARRVQAGGHGHQDDHRSRERRQRGRGQEGVGGERRPQLHPEPMVGVETPKDNEVDDILSKIGDPSLQPVFVHCTEGRSHRPHHRALSRHRAGLGAEGRARRDDGARLQDPHRSR